MANVAVYIELEGDRPHPASLETLGEARRIASFLGATLYAVVPCAAPPQYGDDDVVAVLGRHGADKVVMVPGPEIGTPSLHVTHGATLAAAFEKIPPSLVLLAATEAGRDLAPRVAAKLGAAYVPEPSVQYGPRGELVLARVVYGGAFRRRLAAEDVERAIVATLTPGSYERAVGHDEAEVLVLGGEPPGTGALVEETSASDPGAALDGARIVVTAGAGVSAEVFPLVAELAHRLGGEVAVTHAARERGLAGREREVGIGGRHVSPRLYVAIGASGSPGHLQAVSPDAQIVAINRDPNAPVCRVATYVIIGDAAELLRDLLRDLAPRAAPARAVAKP